MDVIDVLIVLLGVLIGIVRIIVGVVKFFMQKPPAEPSESMREILESMERGEARPVVASPDRQELQPEHEAAEFEETEADRTLLAEQLRLEALAAQAEMRRTAQNADGAYLVEAEAAEPEEAFANRLPELLRNHARDAVALSIILAPPPGLAK